MVESYDLWIRSANPKKIAYDVSMQDVVSLVSGANREDVLSWGLMYWPKGELGYRMVGQEILDLVDATRMCGSAAKHALDELARESEEMGLYD